jgi:hypothetical protein
MSSRRLLQQAFGLMLVVSLLAGCGGAPVEPTSTPAPTPVPPTVTATATKVGPQDVLYTSVEDHMGETVRVCAEVVTQINQLNDTWLSLGDTPAGGGFLVQFPDPATATAAMERDAVDSYYAKDVCVTGVIVEMDSTPVIVIDDTQQIALR